MGQTVYGDLLFVINFSMDFLCFYIVCHLSRIRLHLLRAAIASAFGGIYAVAALLVDCTGVLALAIDLSVMVLICAVALGRESILANTLLYGAISAILGGSMTALYSIFNRICADRGYGADSDGLSVWTFALLAAAGAAATLVGGRRMRMRVATGRAEVIVTTERGSVSMRGFTDSGNLLIDPLGGRAVILCELEAVRSIFSEELCAIWESGNISSAASLAPELAAMLRFVPADGALIGDSTVLAAVRPKSVRILQDEKSVEADVLLAPLPRRLSAGEAKAILPAGLI